MNEELFTVGVVLVMSLLALGAGVVGVYTIEKSDQYQDDYYTYHVKTEQVEAAQTVNDSIQYTDLSAEEEEVLFKAFKKSDHFLGGSSVEVQTEEKFHTFDGWEIVRIKGVPLLVAISEPENETVATGDAAILMAGSIILMIVGTLFTLAAGTVLVDIVMEESDV